VADSDELARLTRLLDEAVLDPALWVAACDRLAAYLGGVGAVLFAEDVERQGPWSIHSPSINGLIEAMFRDRWHHDNIRRRSIPLLKTRGYATDLDIADATAIQRDPFYAELLASHRLGSFVGLGVPAGQDFHIAVVEREIGAPPPDAALMARIGSIQPALAASARASVALGRMKLEWWREVSSDPGRAVFLVDHAGRIIDRNAASENFVGTSVRIRQQHIHLADAAADVRFRQLLAAATSLLMIDPLPPPVFSGLTEGRPIMVEAIRAPASLRSFHSLAAAMVIVRRVGSTESALPELLRRHAKLTEAEIRVALALFEGQSLQDYARSMGLSVGTVRQQLKSIFRKTGTGRQAELLTFMRRLQAQDLA
jgi:DNA-binding CsgD family transcriptional regulator